MLGLLLALGFAYVSGAVFSYILGLGRLGAGWHLAIGIAGQALGWFFLLVLNVPYWVRIIVDGVSVFPIWAAVGTLMVVLVVGILRPGRGESTAAEHKAPALMAPTSCSQP